MERLQKVIAEAGYTSRRKAEELIVAGKVFVNGERVTELGTKVAGDDTIMINGEILNKEDKVYFLFNKPRGVVSTVSDDKDRQTVLDYIDTDKRIYPVGRLDYDTTGVLLLTNDGELTNKLIHPKNMIDKTYIAKVKGVLNNKEAKILENGVVIDGFKTSKSRVKIRKIDKEKDTTIVEITIHEGKNHQVKKMFESINHEVIKLKRESFSFLNVKNMNAGEYRKLTIKEVKKLYNEVEKNH